MKLYTLLSATMLASASAVSLRRDQEVLDQFVEADNGKCTGAAPCGTKFSQAACTGACKWSWSKDAGCKGRSDNNQDDPVWCRCNKDGFKIGGPTWVKLKEGTAQAACDKQGICEWNEGNNACVKKRGGTCEGEDATCKGKTTRGACAAPCTWKLASATDAQSAKDKANALAGEAQTADGIHSDLKAHHKAKTAGLAADTEDYDSAHSAASADAAAAGDKHSGLAAKLAALTKKKKNAQARSDKAESELVKQKAEHAKCQKAYEAAVQGAQDASRAAQEINLQEVSDLLNLAHAEHEAAIAAAKAAAKELEMAKKKEAAAKKEMEDQLALAKTLKGEKKAAAEKAAADAKAKEKAAALEMKALETEEKAEKDRAEMETKEAQRLEGLEAEQAKLEEAARVAAAKAEEERLEAERIEAEEKEIEEEIARLMERRKLIAKRKQDQKDEAGKRIKEETDRQLKEQQAKKKKEEVDLAAKKAAAAASKKSAKIALEAAEAAKQKVKSEIESLRAKQVKPKNGLACDERLFTKCTETMGLNGRPCVPVPAGDGTDAHCKGTMAAVTDGEDENAVYSAEDAAKQTKQAKAAAKAKPSGAAVPADCASQQNAISMKFLPEHGSCKSAGKTNWVLCPSRTRPGECSYYCKYDQSTMYSSTKKDYIPSAECKKSGSAESPNAGSSPTSLGNKDCLACVTKTQSWIPETKTAQRNGGQGASKAHCVKHPTTLEMKSAITDAKKC